jgi:hypothetical protein
MTAQRADGTLRFQLLCYSVEIRAADPRIVATLRYAGNTAEQDVEPAAVLRYEVRSGAQHEILEEGDRLTTVATPDDVLYVIYQRTHMRAMHRLALGGWEQVHAGVGTIAGRRFVLVGAKGTGKTTLMTRLLFDGEDVEGDEVALIRGGDAMAFPRAFHLKAGAELLVPELQPIMTTLPMASTSDGQAIRALDPARSGFRWRIRRQPPAAVVVLAPERAAAPEVRTLTAVEAALHLVEHSLPSGNPPQARVRECARLCADVTAFELTPGPVGVTARLLADTLAASAPAAG